MLSPDIAVSIGKALNKVWLEYEEAVDFDDGKSAEIVRFVIDMTQNLKPTDPITADLIYQTFMKI